VHDGQAVTTGEVLIELDPTMNEAERKHFESDLVAAELDAARLSAALSGETDDCGVPTARRCASPDGLDAASVSGPPGRRAPRQACDA
jgi:hemolysin D